MVLARGGQELAVFEGTVEGVIAGTEAGEQGFGYDSLFIPNGYSETFGELSTEVKNSMSHRNRRKTAKLHAKKKAKHKRARLRSSKGERSTYR